jgi:transmembrane sensor
MSDNKAHIEYLDLIVKELSGENSVEDQKKLHLWLNEDEENQKIFDSYKSTWNEMDRVNGKSSREINLEWIRLENDINFEDSAPLATQRSLFSNVYRYAAVLLFVVVAGFTVYYFLNNQGTEQLVAQVQIQELKLSEGSKVTVNSNSKLTYPKRFQKDKREVELSGEAFFEVSKDPNRPFIIHAGELQVEVLGTSFNVRAYENQNEIEVSVSNGKVAVYRPENPDEKVVLIKGQKAIFYKSSTKIEASINDNINFDSWKTKQIIFEDTPLPEVVRIINEIYKSELKLVGTQLKECPVTTTFDNQSLKSILNVLESTLDLTIEQKGNSFIISGEGC